MRNKLLVTILSTLVLASCGSNNPSPISQGPVRPNLPEMEDAERQVYQEALAIPNKEALRGNIYLPTTYDGAEITWKSSNSGLITDTKFDTRDIGVVTRYEQDYACTLEATVIKDGRYCVIEQECVVLGNANAPTENDYCGYLLVTFTGEGSSNGEQVYMSLADKGKGFKFSALNNNQAILTSTESEKGVRDPFILRSPEGDRFFIIATDLKVNNRPSGGWRNTPHGYTYPTVNGTHTLILWETTDLSNWGEPRYIPVADKIKASTAGFSDVDYPNAGAGMAWAPEMVYHEETGEYVIFFSSCIIDDLTKKDDDKIKIKGDAVYRVTTRDFIHFTEPALFIDNQENKDGSKRNIIDATVRNINGTYYSLTKDGDNGDQEGGIMCMRTHDLLNINAWEKLFDLDGLGLSASGTRVNKFDNTTLEGPELFPFNKCDWKNPEVPEYCIMGDMYNSGAGYLPFATTDLEDVFNYGNSFRVLGSDEYDFSNGGKRHGSVLQLTENEINIIKNKYSA